METQTNLENTEYTATEGANPTPENTEPPQKKKTSIIWLLILIIILLLLLLRCCGNGQSGDGGDTSRPGFSLEDDDAITEGELDLQDIEELKAEMQAKVDASYMNIKINVNPIFDSQTGEGNLMIQNSPDNPMYMQVRLYLEEDDNEHVFYTSPVLKPNQKIQSDEWDEALEVGSYDAVAMFTFIDPENMQQLSETGIRVTITVR